MTRRLILWWVFAGTLATVAACAPRYYRIRTQADYARCILTADRHWWRPEQVGSAWYCVRVD